MKTIQLSDHFTTKTLMRFALPSILMMIFTSIYGVVDGFFISNFVGKTPFAAVNFIMPFLMVLGTIGFMIGTGGCALIGKTLGEGNPKKAHSLFSMFVYSSLAIGVVVSAIGFMAIKPVAILMGADGAMLEMCLEYGHIILLGIPVVMLQYEFQSFFIVAEKPKLGFYITLVAGFMNIILDALLVWIIPLGVAGAAIATVASQVVGGLFPILYFARQNSSLLKLGHADWDMRSMLKTLGNGSSEFVSGVSMNIVNMLYNIQLMKYAGQDGVSAFGVLMYVNMIFIAIFVGYSVGTAPIVSFHYGAQNHDELKSLFRKSLHIIGTFAVLMLIAGEFLARPLSMLFVGYDEGLLELTVHAFRYFSFTFLFAAIPIYGSSFFTALNDGFTSAAISFLRTLVFQTGAILLFPILFGIDGIWISIVVAEIVAALVTVGFWIKHRHKYGYI